MKRIVLLLLAAAIMIAPLSCTEPPGAETEERTEEKSTAENITNVTDAQTAAVTEKQTQTETEQTAEEYMSYQLIRDLRFERGITLLSQKDHQHNDRIKELAKHDFYGGEASKPIWKLAQWDSGPDFVSNLIESPADTLTDGKWRTFRYDPETNTMTFRLDTSAYYGGRPSKEGDYWPHLLIEEGTFEVFDVGKNNKFYNCDSDKLVVSFDIRLGDYKETAIEGDWVRAAQFLMYFYVKGIDTNDFCWFGLQMFDNRWELNGNYTGYDGGKADASGAMIFSIGSRHVYENSGATLWENGSPKPNGDWIHVEIDIKPYLEKMLERGNEDGYFKAKSLSGLRINGMNLGWETIGTFDHTMQMRDLQLVSYRKS